MNIILPSIHGMTADFHCSRICLNSYMANHIACGWSPWSPWSYEDPQMQGANYMIHITKLRY